MKKLFLDGGKYKNGQSGQAKVCSGAFFIGQSAVWGLNVANLHIFLYICKL